MEQDYKEQLRMMTEGLGEWMDRREREQRRRITSLPQEEKAVHAEIVPDEPVDDLRRQFLADILPEKRRMAAGTVAAAVGDFHGQGEPVGDFLQHHGGHFGNILQHAAEPRRNRRF